MIGWKKNQDCPICGRPFGESQASFETPTAYFPGLGKPYGDFLDEDDPLQSFCRKRVHVDCWLGWSERPRFATAWAEWKLEGVKETPDQGLAFKDEVLALVAPAAPLDSASRVRVFFLPLALAEEIPVEAWPAALDDLAARPLTKGAMAGIDALRRRFPDARALTEAVEWQRKPTPCQICQGILGANPSSPVAYRLPQPEFWPATSEARGLRPFGGAIVHTACYLSWPERERFIQVLADVECRLAKLEARRVVAPLSASAFLLAHVDPETSEPAIELLSREARVAVEPARWAQPALPADLRPFERDALLAALPALAAKYPTAAALLDSLDWTAKEVETYQALADQIDECHKLVQAARQKGLRCPRCVARLTDLYHDEGASTVDCPRCGSELTPMDFGWLP